MKKTAAKLLLVLLCVTASACTSYQKMGFSGGVEEVQLSENAWRVTAKGNGFTRRERVANFVLLRSADLATQNGFKYFIFVDQKEWNQKGTIYTPQQSQTTGSVNTFGNTATLNATTTTTGGYYTTINKPNAESVVLMFKEKPQNVNGIVYEASFICSSVGPLVKAKCGELR